MQHINPEAKFMAMSSNYRGDIKSKETNATVETGFKIVSNKRPALGQHNGIRNVTMHTIVLPKNYDLMLVCRSVRKDLVFLEKDYLAVLLVYTFVFFSKHFNLVIKYKILHACISP